MFISHGSADAWTAKQLQKAIGSCGADTFLSVIDVEGGDEIGEEMQDALAKADECLVLYTPEAALSKNVWVEIGAAWTRKMRVVMLLARQSVQDVTSDAKFPPYLKSLNFLDLNAETDIKYLPELKKRIDAKNAPGETS